MITQYVRAAMARARFERLEDGSWYGEIPGFQGVYANSDNREECVRELQEGMAIKVNRETTGSQDVTEEYVDQEARLRALKATEEQYLELMRGTRTTEDIIRVQQSLGQVREQIERTQGRMLYLQRNTAMALISLELYTTGAAKPFDGGGWDAQEVFNGAIRGLVSVARWWPALRSGWSSSCPCGCRPSCCSVGGAAALARRHRQGASNQPASNMDSRFRGNDGSRPDA
ncbi:MAG: DUF4349 domain-containing protein [Chloroflexota bacterium]